MSFSKLSEVLQSIAPLIPSNPDALLLLRSLQPFKHPSLLPSSDVHKLLTRLNGHVLNKELGARATQDRRYSWLIAKCLLDQDEEGYVIGGWGKNWLSGLMPLVASSGLSSSSLAALLSLLTTLFTLSPGHSAFSRETALPAVPKYSQALVGVLSRAEEKGDWDVVAAALPHLPTLLRLSPTPHRPLLPTLTPLLHRFLLLAPRSCRQPSSRHPSIRALSATLLSTLHILTGKVSASAAWKTDLLSCVNEMHACLTSVTRGGLLEQGAYASAGSGARGPITAGMGMMDPASAEEDRIGRLAQCIEGWSDMLLALLRYPTARPVALPVGIVVSLALRVFSLNHETPNDPHISAEHRARLLTVLPRLWVIAAKVLGRLVMAVGDHMLPSLGTILEHTIYLQEMMPKNAHASRLGLLRFHKLLLSRFHPDPSSAAFTTRLLKECLGLASTILSPRPAPSESQSAQAMNSNAEGMSKKGKKRMRNAAEETLVAGMEGRGGKSMTTLEGQVVLAALELIPHLITHPGVPEHLLAFAVRVHLSLSLALPTKSAASICDQDVTLRDKLKTRIADVLECAMTLCGGHGSRRGWASLIVALPELQTSARLPLLLHPEVPPLSRPLPPASTLVFYRPETEDERAVRVELGISIPGEALAEITTEIVEAAAQQLQRPAPVAVEPRPAKRQATDSIVDWGGSTNGAKVVTSTVPQVGEFAVTSQIHLPNSDQEISASAVPVTKTTQHSAVVPAVTLDTLARAEVDEALSANQTEPQSLGFSSAGLPPAAAAKIAIPAHTTTVNDAGQVAPSRTEGTRYDSEGEEIPEICLDSDTEEGGSDESDEDMA